jgi:hypothetical protein
MGTVDGPRHALRAEGLLRESDAGGRTRQAVALRHGGATADSASATPAQGDTRVTRLVTAARTPGLR